MLTIRELIKTLYNAFNQKLKNHRGNWEQNDPTADDYIKNRPFYTDENDKTIVIRETNVTIGASERGAVANGGYTTITYSPIIELVIGQSYTVTWNGKDYECIAYEARGIAAIGNNSMLDREDASASNEPFFIAVSKDMFGGAYISASESGTHTVKVIQRGKIVKIDKKYLPDDLITDLAPVATSGSYNDLTDTPTIYTDVVRYNASQSLTDVQKTQARTNIGAVNAWDDLNNKPFWDELIFSNFITIFNKSITSRITSQSGNTFFTEVYDIDFSEQSHYVSFLIKQNATIFKRTDYTKGVYNSDLNFFGYKSWYVYGNIHLWDMSKEDTGEDWCIFINIDNKRIIGHIGNNLTWNNTFHVSYNTKTEITHQLDEKYIPDTIQRVYSPKNYITLIDQVNGIKYRVAMRDGALVSYTYVDGIIVTSLPDKTIYTAGEYFDPTGMVVSAMLTDGTTKEITDYALENTTFTTEGQATVVVSYTTEDNDAYTANVLVNVSAATE